MTEEEILQVVNYITALLPTITAIVSLIGSIIYIFKKTGNISQQVVDQVNDLATAIKEDNANVNEENKKLRADLKALSMESAELRAKVSELVENTSRIRRK